MSKPSNKSKAPNAHTRTTKLDHKIKAIPITKDDHQALQLILDTLDKRPELRELIRASDVIVREQCTRGRPSTDHQDMQHVNRFIYRAGLNFILRTLIDADNESIPTVNLPNETDRPELRELLFQTLWTSHENYNPDLAQRLNDPDISREIADIWLERLMLLNPPSDIDAAYRDLANSALHQLLHHHYTRDQAIEEYDLRGRILNERDCDDSE